MSERVNNEIEIKDLPAEETLTPEEKERLAGAGRKPYQPRFETLEAREMMDAAGIEPPPTSSSNEPPPQMAHVRTMGRAGSTRAATPVAENTLLGPVQTLKGGTDQSGNLIAGTTDASAAAVFTTQSGQKFMFVAGDEDQSIRMYKFNAATKEYTFVKAFDFTANLGLTERDGKKGQGPLREVDIEAVSMIDNKLYWTGSGSNRGQEFKDAPNRDRIFRTDIREVNGQPELSFVGYARMEEALVGQVSRLKTAAEPGVDPKHQVGYNIEGLTRLPDGNMGIAYRASGGTSAVIVPVTNLDAVLTGGVKADGQPKVAPQFAAPIELDLGGRGIRDIMGSTYTEGDTVRHQYLIIAGPAGNATGSGNNDFRLYTWTGNANDQPVMHTANLLGLTPEAIVLPEGNTKWDANTEFGLISDDGATMFDNNKEGKDKSQAAKDRQSRINWVKLGAVATDGSFSNELVEIRRQGNLEESQAFTFTATGSNAYFEVLGEGRSNVKVEVIDPRAIDISAASKGVSGYKVSTDRNVLSLSGLEAGKQYTVRVTPTVSGDASTGVYTLSWRV